MAFLARGILNGAATATLVRVTSVTNSGGLSPVGFVSVHPLVNQVDGVGRPTPHGTINHLPYFRLQGGANAVIIDPAVGDIGVAVFASHDISSVKATKAEANPGSRRRFAWADGMYFGGMLNGTPSQVVRFSADGITLTSPTRVTVTAPDIVLTGNVATTGTLTNNGKNVGSTHTHGGVTTGGGTTGVPT